MEDTISPQVSFCVKGRGESNLNLNLIDYQFIGTKKDKRTRETTAKGHN